MKNESVPTENNYENLIFSAWLLQNRKISNLINRLPDEDLNRDIMPGRNSGVYLLGHLIASNDLLMPLFGFGDKMFPEYEKIFLCTPDKCVEKLPAANQLKAHWFVLNEQLRMRFMDSRKNEADENPLLSNQKLSTLLYVINHQCYHLGQLSFLL